MLMHTNHAEDIWNQRRNFIMHILQKWKQTMKTVQWWQYNKKNYTVGYKKQNFVYHNLKMVIQF